MDASVSGTDDGVVSTDVERARRLVLEHGWNATAYQILNPGIRLWFAAGERGVVGYVRHGRTCVVAGAPVCACGELAAVAAEFEHEAALRREQVCYFAAESRLEAVVRAPRPYAKVRLGAQPVWRPERFVATIAGHASLRAQVHRARNKGIEVAEWPHDRAVDPRLRQCLADWLATRGLPALHFLVESETLGALHDRRLFVAQRDGVPVAFLVATPIPARSGWLVEQIVRGRSACNGTSELLLDAAARAMAAGGAEHMTLGLAPLAMHGALAGGAEPAWVRMLFAGLRTYGRRFYDFRGLEAFKTKFRPEAWEPVFALASTDHVRASTLHAIAGVFARGSPTLLAARCAVRAASGFVRGLVRGRAPRVAFAAAQRAP